MLNKSLLEHAIVDVDRILTACELCERRCRVNRKAGETGYCGLSDTSFVFKDFLHFGEEAELIPSHTIYFGGCNFRCVFCSNMHNVEHPDVGEKTETVKLASRIDEMHKNGVKNVNFLGGEPTLHLSTILRVLLEMKSGIPVVWNSNMYATVESLGKIHCFTDIYLADFKYGNDTCAGKLADTQPYVEIIKRNLLWISEHLEHRQLIIRHLPLKGHIECCSRPVLQWIKEHLPLAEVSLLKAFISSGEEPDAGGKNIRSLSDDEYKILSTYIKDIGLNCVKEISLQERKKRMDKYRNSNSSEIFGTNLMIKKDGTCVIQDMNQDLINLV